MKPVNFLPAPLLMLLAFAAVPQVALAQVVGVTAAVRNDVRLTTPADPRLHQARLRERVAIGNDVVTGKASMAQLLLLDKTSFSVGANARVRIDRFVYDPVRKASSVTGSVAKGAFRFMSGRALHGGGEPSSIRTPVATIGVRGTIFEGAVGADAVAIARREGVIPANATLDAEGATLVVLRGPGRNAEGGQVQGAIDVTANGVTVAVEEAGLAVFVAGPGQDPTSPFRLSNRGLRALHLLLRAMPVPQDDEWWTSDLTTDRQFECTDNDDSGSASFCSFQR